MTTPTTDLTSRRTFADLGLPPTLVDALARAGITSPFPIQSATLPDSLAGRDVPTRAASVARPSLDDVFLRETGRSLRDAGAPSVAAGVAEVAA